MKTFGEVSSRMSVVGGLKSEVSGMQSKIENRQSKMSPFGIRQSAFGIPPGFTLIEILVVVAIIAILAAISVPVISRALEGAKRAQAHQEIKALETALRGYYNEYSRWPHGSGQPDIVYPPGQSGGPVNNFELINVLRAVDGTGNNNPAHSTNPRRQVFLEASDTALSPRVGTGVTAERNRNFIDPWEQPYMIALDTDFNGNVNTGSAFGTIQRRTIAIWSWGPTGSTQTNDAIRSWQ